MIIEFFRNLIGTPPDNFTLDSLPQLVEYFLCAMVVMVVVYTVLRLIFTLFSSIRGK